MIQRTVKLQLLAFAILSVVGVVYTSATYIGFTERFINPPYSVAVDLAESGGIFPNAEVTYRGVAVGRVGDLELLDDGVRVELRIKDGEKIPKDLKAIVQNKSAVGEQYVDLLPESDDGPYLTDGDRIAMDRTSTPIPPEELLLNLDRLVNSIGREELATVIDELGKGFNGAERSLQTLVDEGNKLTLAATEALPETIRLIEDGETVLDTQRASGTAIRSFADDLADLSAQLRDSDADLRRLFVTGQQSGAELSDFLARNQQNIGLLAGNLTSFSQVISARLPAVEQLMITYPVVVTGGFTVVPGDGTSHFGLVTEGEPQPCRKGYESTPRRSANDLREVGANVKAYCAEPDGSEVNVRGSQNAPRFPGSNYGNGTGNQAIADASARTATRSENGGPSRPINGGSSAQSSGAAPRTSAYDPLTGTVFTGDGQQLTIGSTGGQAAVLGEDSWKWLLLGPLSR